LGQERKNGLDPSHLRPDALSLVGVVACGTSQPAEVQQGLRACGIDGLYARLDEATTLTLALPNAAPNARPSVRAAYRKAPRTAMAFAEDFDPIRDKEIVVLPAAAAGEIALSVRFGLDRNLPNAERKAVLATPGSIRLSFRFPTASGPDACSVDVNLLAPVEP
jgi:hypothetical protein